MTPLQKNILTAALIVFVGTTSYTTTLDVLNLSSRSYSQAAATAPITQLAIPRNVRAIHKGSHIRVTWQDTSTRTNEIGFEIIRSTDPDFKPGPLPFPRVTVAPNVTVFDDYGISPTGTYYYRVRAMYAQQGRGMGPYINYSGAGYTLRVDPLPQR